MFKLVSLNDSAFVGKALLVALICGKNERNIPSTTDRNAKSKI
jgi:hypothetical protein